MKAIKSFIPVALSNDAFFKWCQRAAKSPNKTREALAKFMVRDPFDFEWTSFGMCDALEDGHLVHDLDGRACLIRFKFNKRALPAVVRDQEITKRLTELQERKGDVEISKQEFAQIRDDVEHSLLPEAFIVPSYVSVLVYRDRVLFCTTSARRVIDMSGFFVQLLAVRNVKTELYNWDTENSMSWLMTQAAKDEDLTSGEDEGELRLYAGDAVVLKSTGEDRRTVRFKDREVSSQEVQQVLASPGYQVTEIQLRAYDDGGDAVYQFAVNQQWAFKAVKVDVPEAKENLQDLHATYWMYALELQRMLDVVLELLVVKPHEAVEDEEEL